MKGFLDERLLFYKERQKMKRKAIHCLPEPDNGKVACGSDVLKVQYHAYSKQGVTCKRCKLTRRFWEEGGE